MLSFVIHRICCNTFPDCECTNPKFSFWIMIAQPDGFFVHLPSSCVCLVSDSGTLLPPPYVDFPCGLALDRYRYGRVCLFPKDYCYYLANPPSDSVNVSLAPQDGRILCGYGICIFIPTWYVSILWG
jgi:hypothetical protein